MRHGDYMCPWCDEPAAYKREDGTAQCEFCGAELDEEQAAKLREVDNDPGDPDGETFRGHEAAGFAAEEAARAQRLK